MLTAKVEVENKTKILDLTNFGKSQTILNRSKPLVPEVNSSSSDKAKFFAMNLADNSTLDDKCHSLPDFPLPFSHREQTL